MKRRTIEHIILIYFSIHVQNNLSNLANTIVPVFGSLGRFSLATSIFGGNSFMLLKLHYMHYNIVSPYHKQQEQSLSPISFGRMDFFAAAVVAPNQNTQGTNIRKLFKQFGQFATQEKERGKK